MSAVATVPVSPTIGQRLAALDQGQRLRLALGVVLFVAGVLVGADSMSRVVGVPTYIADVIVATSLIAVLVATLLAQYRVRWK